MRAPLNEPKEYKSIGLPVRLWDFVKHVGNGQYSHGIRYVIEQAYMCEQRQANHSPLTRTDSESNQG